MSKAKTRKSPKKQTNSGSVDRPDPRTWANLVAQYQTPSTRKSIWQVVNTFVPFFLLWAVMVFTLDYSYWLTLALAVPAAGFLVRIFIIQHDCGHGSFFTSRRANDALGSVCGLLTLTPYYYWRKSHSIHHASAGNLADRGVGDIYTMTVKEYLQASTWDRFKYRFYRHPLFLFVLAPAILFLVLYRFPHTRAKSWKKERASVWWTNIGLAAIITGLSLTIGWQAFLLVFLPVMLLAAAAGTWMFFVQHQFEETYWAGEGEWDYTLAALQGSSYYKLPLVLQWFTGNIGFHHIHHLSPRIPNYLLQKCHEDNPPFQQTVQLTLWSSLKSAFLSLWDEERGRLVSFRQLDLKRTT